MPASGGRRAASGCRTRLHEFDRSTPLFKACCDMVNRRAAYATAISSTTCSTTRTIAIYVKTGRKVWRRKLGGVEHGETMRMAPFKVFVGNSDGTIGERG